MGSYERELKARLPGVPLKPFSAGENPLDERAGFDAVALPAERGSVLTMLDPKWTVVVPQPGIIKVPIAFPLARNDLGGTYQRLDRDEEAGWNAGSALHTLDPGKDGRVAGAALVGHSEYAALG